MLKMDEIQRRLLLEVADLHDVPQGAYNLRANGKSVGRSSSANIEITSKEDGSGIDIRIKPGTKNESVHIPVVMTQSGLKDLVYNDFHVQSGADVTIVAGCGVHTDAEEGSNHNGIHRFFLESGSHVVYKEKHIGIGEGGGKRVIDPVTYAELDDGAVLEMETLQLGGVDETTRDTTAILKKNASLIIHESIMTDNDETASTKFSVDMEGEDSNVDLISRSVAKGNSFQEYTSSINGKCKCKGHSECDAILVGNGRVNASPALNASSVDANLIHEAAIGKIAGEQIIKLMTLGLTEEEAEERIIAGFLGA